ncbi:MAG: hypothetical protein HOW73_34585 [Polyangiaceae bacterium]|nr:hypothetical protein [Polyangiaceae bacterium]
MSGPRSIAKTPRASHYILGAALLGLVCATVPAACGPPATERPTMEDWLDVIDQAAVEVRAALDDHDVRVASAEDVDAVLEVEGRDAERTNLAFENLLDGWYAIHACQNEAVLGQLPYLDETIGEIDSSLRRHAISMSTVASLDEADALEQAFQTETSAELDDVEAYVETLRTQAEERNLTDSHCPRPPFLRPPSVDQAPRA